MKTIGEDKIINLAELPWIKKLLGDPESGLKKIQQSESDRLQNCSIWGLIAEIRVDISSCNDLSVIGRINTFLDKIFLHQEDFKQFVYIKFYVENKPRDLRAPIERICQIVS